MGDFYELFKRKPIIGAIHLAGPKPVDQALREIDIYVQSGLDGIMIENCFGSESDVRHTLEKLSVKRPNIKLGINILPVGKINTPEMVSFNFAREYHLDFIVIDAISGMYTNDNNLRVQLNSEFYAGNRESMPELVVLGGIWPGYLKPFEGFDPEQSITHAGELADAVLIKKYPGEEHITAEKIRTYKELTKKPVVPASGVRLKNLGRMIATADGVIAGKAFKYDENNELSVNPEQVKEFMHVANEYRMQ